MLTEAPRDFPTKPWELPPLSSLEVGSEVVVPYGPVTRALIHEYGETSEDRNMIHLDDAIAEKFGLKGVIGHGGMNFSNLIRIMDEWLFGQGRLLEIGVQFRGIYRPGDTVYTIARVDRIEGNVIHFTLEQRAKTPLYVTRDGETVERFEADERGWVSEKDRARDLLRTEPLPDGGTLHYRWRAATRGSAIVEYQVS